MATLCKGGLPSFIRNDEGLYEGNLIYYFKIICDKAQNLLNPYHNFRHMFHVPLMCHMAIRFYAACGRPIAPRKARNLLIAALLHDFDHSGMLGHDDLNIARALRGLEKYIAPEDRPFLSEIGFMISGTQYPYIIPVEDLDLCGWILRDADLSQTLSVAWIQQVIYGLAAEWRMRPIEVLRMQEPFLAKLTFLTEWAKSEFPESSIREKIEESRELLELFEAAA